MTQNPKDLYLVDEWYLTENKLICNPHSHHGYEKIQDVTTMSNIEFNKEVILSPTNSRWAPPVSSEIQ